MSIVMKKLLTILHPADVEVVQLNTAPNSHVFNIDDVDLIRAIRTSARSVIGTIKESPEPMAVKR